jgi:hypothetical protein
VASGGHGRERDTRDNRAAAFLISLRGLLQGDRDESLHALHRAGDELTDPEAKYDRRAQLRPPLGAGRCPGVAQRRGPRRVLLLPRFVTDPWLNGIRHLQPFPS